MSKEQTMADRHRDPCALCGKDLSRTTCKNVYCSANARYYGTFSAPKRRQGPGHRKRKLRPGEAMRRQFRERGREEAHWSRAKRTGRWAWPM